MSCPKPAAAAAGASDGSGSTSIVSSAVTATGWHLTKIEGFSKLIKQGAYPVGMGIKCGDKFIVGGHSWSIECYPGGFKKDFADCVSFGLYLHPPARSTDDADVKAGYRLSILDKDGEPVHTHSCSVRTYSSSGHTWALTNFIKRMDLESSYLGSTNDSICIRCDVTIVEDICEESVVPKSDLHRYLGDLLGSEVGGDVTFEVGGEDELVAHQYLLAARSSVFKAQFFGGPMKDKTATRVRLDDIEVSVFKAMLHFIYTDSLPDTDRGDKVVMSRRLLVAAERYNIGRLKLICNNMLHTFINTSVHMSCPKPAAAAVAAASDGGSTSIVVSSETTSGWHVLKIEGFSKLIKQGGGYHTGMGTNYGNFSVGGHSWSIRCYPRGFDQHCADFVSFGLHLHPPPRSDDVDVKAVYWLSILDKDGEPVYTRNCSMSTYSSRETWALTKFIQRIDLESTYLSSTNDSICVRCDVTVVEDISEKSVVPKSDLHQHLGDLLGSEVGGDVTFEVGGEELVAHKYLLAARSSVFKAQFFGNLLRDKTATRVRVADIEVSVFKAMLHFIYTDSLPGTERGDKVVMAQHLLVTADKYNLGRLKLICENTLRTFINTSVVTTSLVLAEQHGCRRLKEACLKFLKSSDNFKAVGGDDYEHLMRSCPYLLDELLAAHGLSSLSIEGSTKA